MNPLDQNSSFNGPLTPHHFKHNSSNNNNNNNNSSAQQTAKGLSLPTKYAPIAIAGLALLILPITIWQINTQQDIRQQASTPQQQIPQEAAIALFGDEKITESDIDEEYTKQQNATTYTVAPTSLRSQILDDIIKKKIIAKEASSRGISVSEEEIDEKIDILNNLDLLTTPNREHIKDLVLEEKVASVVADSRGVNIIFSENNSPQTLSFFELIRNEAEEKESLVSTAEPLVRQSRDIYLLDDISITSDSKLLPQESEDAVFALQPFELSEIIEGNNRFFIIEILSESQGEYDSLQEFIDEKRQSLVQIL